MQKEQEAEQDLIDEGCAIIHMDTDQFIEYFKDFTDEKFPYLADWAAKIRAVDTEDEALDQ